MSAEIYAPKEVAPVQQAGDSSALSSAQADSFKGLDNFSSIKSSMSDSSTNSLPDLQLVDSNAQPSDTNQNRAPGENQNPGNELPKNPGETQDPGNGERNDNPNNRRNDNPNKNRQSSD